MEIDITAFDFNINMPHVVVHVVPDRPIMFTRCALYFLQVRFTFLEVEETCRKKIRDTPANHRGPLKLEAWEHPRFFYSKPFNILKQADRMDVFKGLMLIRSMQEKISKVQ